MNKNYNFFMSTDISSYAGQWIAICENKIVAKGDNIKKVFHEAKAACPGKRPLLSKVPTTETMIL